MEAATVAAGPVGAGQAVFRGPLFCISEKAEAAFPYILYTIFSHIALDEFSGDYRTPRDATIVEDRQGIKA